MQKKCQTNCLLKKLTFTPSKLFGTMTNQNPVREIAVGKDCLSSKMVSLLGKHKFCFHLLRFIELELSKF